MGCIPSDLWLHRGGWRRLVGLFPQALGALFALLGWFTTHFDVAFDKEKEGPRENQNQRLYATLTRSRRNDPTPAPEGCFAKKLDLGVDSRVYALAMSLKVSELADRAGVSSDTIRYYEKEGLLAEPARTHSGYRQYDEAAVERLHFIRGAQTLGLKLGDIKELLAIRDRGACPCGHTQRLLEQRVAEIDEEIRELRTLRRELQSMERLHCPSDASSSQWPCEIEFVKRGGERVG